MFIIKPEKPEDWQHAMFMLSYYHVDITIRSNGEDAESVYMVVEDTTFCCSDRDDEREEQLRLAEAHFQSAWRQVGNVCPDCESREDICGHLTFNNPISPAF